jgi:phage gpG-like protein
MSGGVTINIDDKEVQDALESLQSATGSIDGPMDSIGRKIVTKVKLGFRGSVSPFGEKWLPLKHRKGGKPLRDTNRLRDSITHRVGGDADSQHVDIGTNVSYAPYHQFGATIKTKARTVNMYRKLLASGDFANKGRFVKKSKSNFVQSRDVGEGQIVIPARPFLPIKAGDLSLPGAWESDVVNTIVSHLKRTGALT